jgi:hypothetical protein
MISASGNVYGTTGSFVGGITATNATGSFGNITASGNIHVSSVRFNGYSNFLIAGVGGAGHVSASRVSASAGFEADTLSTSSFGYISASGGITSEHVMSASGFNTTKNLAASADALSYIVNGRKVEVRNQVQATLSDGAFSFFELRNTSIAADSIVLGSFTGNTAGAITGSMITAATIAQYTAAIQIHNETGEAVADDTTYTASFIIL